MANQRYNRKTNITMGSAYKSMSMKNRAKKVHDARVQGNYTEAQEVFDAIDYIFQNEDINLSEATRVVNPNKIKVHDPLQFDSKIQNLLSKLHSENFFLEEQKFGPNSAIEKAINFNEKIVFNQKGVSTFASYTDVNRAYDQLQYLKRGSGHLYLFDTETIGGTNKSKIWSPLGITEFAMQKVNMKNGAVEKTNIVLGTAPTEENEAVIEKILNALGDSLDNNVDKSKLKIDPNIIMKDEQLRVTAMRYGIYGSPESVFEDTGKGYMKAKSLASSEINNWLDPKLIKEGYLKNKQAFEMSPMTKYGINKAQLEFIDSVAEMYRGAKYGNSMIGGQNIVPFDIPVVNSEIRRIQNNLQDIINGKLIDPKVTVAEAKAGLAHISKSFDGLNGVTFEANKVFDTLPFINYIKDTFGVDPLYKHDQAAIAKAGNGLAKQENIGAVWFPKLFASGEAHMADFDVDVLRHLFTSPIAELNNETFIDHFMTKEGGQGLKGVNFEAKKIKAGGEQQLFYARKGTQDKTFGGKGMFNYSVNKKTGEVFFNSKYEIAGNTGAKFNPNINRSTHINKGQFYYVDSIKKINTADLPAEFGDVFPELNGQEIMQVRMRMAVADKYKGQGLEDVEYVLNFANEYEVSGWFSSHMGMTAEKDAAGNWVLGQDAMEVLEQIEIKDGQVIRNIDQAQQSTSEILQTAMGAKNKQKIADKTLYSVTDPDKMYDIIDKQVRINKKLSAAGLKDVTREEIESLIAGTPIARMSNMSHKQSRKVIGEIKDIVGKSKSVPYTWDFVSMRGDFYTKVFNDLETFSNNNKITKAQRKLMFGQIIEDLSAQVADSMYDDVDDIRNAVYSSAHYAGSIDRIMNTFEIEMPENFIFDQPKKQKLLSGLNVNANNRVLSLRLDNKNSSSFELANKLVDMKFGTRKIDMNPDHFKRIALFQFAEHLQSLDDFMGNSYVEKAMEHMMSDTEGFGVDNVSKLLIDAMIDVKKADPTKGVINDVFVRSTENISPEYLRRLNTVSNEMINKTIGSASVPVILPGKSTNAAIEKYVKSNVLQHYMPSRTEFNKTLVGLTDEQKWLKTQLYNNLESQITNRLVDVTTALSQVPGGDLFISPEGQFIFKQGQDVVPVTNLIKVKLDGDTLYGQVGKSPVQIKNKYIVDPNTGAVSMGTNLDEFFNRGKAATRKIKRKVEDGNFRPDDVAYITSHLTEKFRQDSRYEFKSGDWYSNFLVDTGDIDTILPKIFGENGQYAGWADFINIPDEIKQTIKERIGEADKEILSGELDPQLNQYIMPFRTQIAKDLATIRGDADVQRMASGLTIGTKGKGKLEKGTMMGANTRFETGVLDSFDNTGRPVLDSSGNVIWMPIKNIKNAESSIKNGVFYEGTLFESITSNKVNKRITDGVGEISSAWTSRTAYVGEMGLQAILDNNMDEVLANCKVAVKTEEQKRKVYNSLYSYLNTFEQQKIYNARAFDAMTNHAMAANTIKLSSAKDFINLPREEKHVEQYKRLLNLMGDIQIDSNDVVTYKSSVGEIVKRGDSLIPYATYGGEAANWTTKMDRSLMTFQVRNKQGVRLSDEEISAVLTKNKNLFKGLDLTDTSMEGRAKTLRALNRALDDFEINFAVEDINRIQLPKILINNTEKSMNHILYAKTGTINEKVANVFRYYGGEAEELLGGTVLSEQALEAVFKDPTKRMQALKMAGYGSNWKKFKSDWLEESYVLSDMIFGKGGLFEGFTDIANDGVLGHGNKGTMLTGSLEEAINMLGKYTSGNKKETNASRLKGMKEFAKMYNSDEKYQFFQQGVDFSGSNGRELEVVDGHFRFKGGAGLNTTLDEADYVDYKKLENLIRDIDQILKNKGATPEDRLIHRVDIQNDGTRFIALDNDGTEGTELIGRMKYMKNKNGQNEIVGSIGSLSHKLIHDPETQSSLPQEYFDTKMKYLKLKGKKINWENQYQALEKEWKQGGFVDPDVVQDLQIKIADANIKLSEMDEYLTNMKGTGNVFRVGDQEEKIIKNYFVDRKSFERIQLGIDEGRLSKEAVSANEAIRGIKQSDYEGRKAYQNMLDTLDKQKYYNPYIDSTKLTPDMLELDKYAHLKDVYDYAINVQGQKKIGLETAEIMHDIRMAELANEFNNRRADIDKITNAGFELMTPKEYLNNFGDPNVPGYSSVYKKNVLLKMDMMDGSDPIYVAVPGMGSVLDKAEIKQDWHTYAGRLAEKYQLEYLATHGEPTAAAKVLGEMDNIITDLKKSTKGYMEKGSVLHDRMRQEVHAAVDRVKIISTMPTDKNPLFTQAMVDGKSLADWTKEGIYYDYAFDSLESFEKRGYFKKDFLKKMNMTKEEMIEHLRTEGTIMLDDRHPNIRPRSLTPIRHYLAMDENGTSFLANNATMMSPWTMLAMNADSDGDSVSRFLVKNNNVDYVQYGVARNRAMKAIDAAGNYANDIEREELIQSQTIANIKGMGFRNFSDEDYMEFKTRDISMADYAMTKNQEWYDAVKATWDKDAKNTKVAMSIMKDGQYTQAEVVGGKSILGYTKITALSETPDWKIVDDNISKVNNALKAIQDNAQYLSDETRESVKKILESPADIWKHNDESDILDKALIAMKELSSDTNASAINSTGFSNFQFAAIKRVAINRYHEEAMQKLGVTATGNVNSTLYGVSQAIKTRYGDNASPLYDELKRHITSDISYWLEETPISGKKFKIKAGDERMFEFADAFKNLEHQGATKENLQAMENYLTKYMNHDWLTDAYDSAMNSIAKPMAERLQSPEEKVNYVVKQYVSYVQEALDKSGPMYAEVKMHSSLGRRNANPDAMFHASGRVDTSTNAGEAVAMVTGRTPSMGEIPDTILRSSAKENAKNIANTFEMPDVNTHTATEALETASNTISRGIINGKGFKSGLAMGVVGLAAGLIASGYASGNPLNDPDPATIAQKGYEGVQAAPEMMFSSSQGFAPNNTGGYIINIKGDTRKGNRQLKKALKQATRNSMGGGIQMSIKTSQKQGPYSDNDIENILNNFF